MTSQHQLIHFKYRKEDTKIVEPLSPPEGSVIGDRVSLEGYESCKPAERLNPKKKVWENSQVIL